MQQSLFQMRLKFLPILICLLLAVPVFAQAPDQSGEAAPDVDTLKARPEPVPPAPAELVKAVDTPNDHGHAIDLEWILSPDDDTTGNYVTGYQIWRGEKTEKGTIEFIMRKAVPYGVSTYTDRGDAEGGRDVMPNGKNYWYKIVTVAKGDVTSESNVLGPVQAKGNWYHYGKTPVAVAVLIFASFSVAFVVIAGGNIDMKQFYILWPIVFVIIIWLVLIVRAIMGLHVSFLAFVLAIPGAFVGSFGLGISIGAIGFLVGLAIRRSKGEETKLYVRPLAGISAVDEAIGRATEMGKPILYVLGLGTASDIATICSFTILGRVSRKVADHQSSLMVPCYDPIVMTVAQEVVKNAYTEAGRPDAYSDDQVFFVTQSQFAYVAAVNGMMLRELPASNFYLGIFYAESLLLAETGSLAGSIQIAGTDQVAQLPFFIVACDYTLIGEELYAASAYLSGEPTLLGSLKAEDWGKAIFIALTIIGVIAATVGWQQFIDWMTVRI
jgi:hypothetical protein